MRIARTEDVVLIVHTRRTAVGLIYHSVSKVVCFVLGRTMGIGSCIHLGVLSTGTRRQVSLEAGHPPSHASGPSGGHARICGGLAVNDGADTVTGGIIFEASYRAASGCRLCVQPIRTVKHRNKLGEGD